MRSTIHEIRNQLAVAVANVEAFLDRKFEPTHDRLEAVLHALLEVDVLINDLVVVPLPAAPAAMHEVDICDVILSELVALEPSAAAAGISLRVDRCSAKHSSCMNFTCDPGQIRQIVKNVMLNAIKYTPRDGVVWVDCHREPGVMSLAISDDGPGVLLEERLVIFDAEKRGSASRGSVGSGMGLAIVKRIVDAHGGTVAVDQSDLGGARFLIRLPGSATGSGTCTTCAHGM